MSKWIKEDLFAQFKNDVQEEAEKKSTNNNDLVWKNPEPGTQSSPKQYIIRLLPDIKRTFLSKILLPYVSIWWSMKVFNLSENI